MNDASIRSYMRRLMDEEIGPLLAPVPGIDLARYKATLIARFANPAIRDTVRRINTDAPVNLLLDPLRDALAADAPISLLVLGLAAWCQRTQDDIQRGGDPAALLSVESLFGDLGRNARLMESLRSWLGAFHAGGVPATLRNC